MAIRMQTSSSTHQQRSSALGASVGRPIWLGFFAGVWIFFILLVGFVMVFAVGEIDRPWILDESFRPVAFFLIAAIPALYVRSSWRLAAAAAIVVLISIGVELARSIWLQSEFRIIDTSVNVLCVVGGALIVAIVRRRSTQRRHSGIQNAHRLRSYKLASEEAALAVHIAEGRSLAEYAVLNNRSIALVREDVQAIYAKVGGRSRVGSMTSKSNERAESVLPEVLVI